MTKIFDLQAERDRRHPPGPPETTLLDAACGMIDRYVTELADYSEAQFGAIDQAAHELSAIRSWLGHHAAMARPDPEGCA